MKISFGYKRNRWKLIKCLNYDTIIYVGSNHIKIKILHFLKYHYSYSKYFRHRICVVGCRARLIHFYCNGHWKKNSKIHKYSHACPYQGFIYLKIKHLSIDLWCLAVDIDSVIHCLIWSLFSNISRNNILISIV